MTGRPRGVLRIARLAALAGLAKGPGFLIPVIIAAFFGAGNLTDAYFLAYGGVLLVGGTVGQPLEAAVVPFAAHAFALGRRAADAFLHTLFRRGFLLGVAATVIGALLLWAGLSVSRLEEISTAQVFGFYLLLAPAAVAWCVAALYTGSLVAAWHLEVGAIGYGFRGMGALVGAGISGMIHELWPVAVGVSVGEWGRVWWLRTRWRRALRGMAEGVNGTPERGLVAAAANQITAQGFISAAQFLERFLVGTVAVAAISHVEYANRLIMVAAVLFDGAVGPWLLARWSNVHVRRTLKSDWTTVYRLLALAGAAALVVAGALVVAAPLIVGVVLHHGAFADADAVAVTQILRWYSVGYFFNTGALCVERLLVARAQNRIFARLAALRAVTRVVTVLIFLGSLGVLALPAGSIVSEAIYLAVLLVVSKLETAPRADPVQP